MPQYDGQLIIDADHRPDGWQLGFRFGSPESRFFSGLFGADADLRGAAAEIGEVIVNALIADRDAR
jgi:hypothetical protein